MTKREFCTVLGIGAGATLARPMDNTIYAGLGGAALATECISWGKEAKGAPAPAPEADQLSEVY